MSTRPAATSPLAGEVLAKRQSGATPPAEVRLADEAGVTAAVDLLAAGDVIGLPTETVYGLAADAGNAQAVAQIYRIKGRPTDHPLIVHVLDATVAARWADWDGDGGASGGQGEAARGGFDRRATVLAAAFWPGPLTLVLRRRADAPGWACAGQSTIALRSPSHPVARAVLAEGLVRGIDGLAAPSANRYGRVSPTRASHVVDDLGSDLALVLDGGDAEVGIESTIVDLSGPETRVLRPGGIDAASIFRALASLTDVVVSTPVLPSTVVPSMVPSVDAGATAAVAPADRPAVMEPTDGGAAATPLPRVPGDRASHYAPVTPTVVRTVERLAAEIDARCRAGQRVAVWSVEPPATADITEFTNEFIAAGIKEGSKEGSMEGSQERSKRGGGAVRWRARPTDPIRLAHTLYETLRELDRAGCDVIVIEAPPVDEAWAAVNDRLARASAP